MHSTFIKTTLELHLEVLDILHLFNNNFSYRKLMFSLLVTARGYKIRVPETDCRSLTGYQWGVRHTVNLAKDVEKHSDIVRRANMLDLCHLQRYEHS